MSARRRVSDDELRDISSRPEGADYPRSRTQRTGAPEEGWRASKRSSKLGKQLRRDARAEQLKAKVNKGVRTGKNNALGLLQILGLSLVSVTTIVLVLALVVFGVNAGARWFAQREAKKAATPEARAEKARENLLIIGSDGQTAEFLAVRLDETDKQILGVAVPGGAFMEVPGQGFERVGDSFAAGAGVSLAAISNYLTVPFEHYVVVDTTVYQDAMTNQSLKEIMSNVQETDLNDQDRDRIAGFIEGVSGDRTALVPLPVKPIDLGGQTYYEPQRDDIADLLLQWWDVRLGAEDTTVRVIIYNGAGAPGIAGSAAQQLIAAGMRVVDTKNADRFDYATTMVIVQHGNTQQGELVKSALGVGEIVEKPSDQDVADVIVIIGKDYEPPAVTGAS